MKITIVAAVSDNGFIGKGNKLPWRIKEEMAHFHAVTQDKAMIVGRKTFDGLPKSLQNEPRVIVLSRAGEYANTLAKAINFAKEIGYEEVAIIGGANVYEQAILEYANELIISYVHRNVEGDVKMPYIEYNNWIPSKVTEGEEFTTVWWKRRNV